MINEDGTPNRGHTNNLVPFIICDKHVKLKDKGIITQIAPTLLKYMNIAIPKQMEDTKVLFKLDL
ncbi:MAG TPA: 2,3-bisphosphoglycerate-independent phosphoglycerate mutase, partial [Bacilli bacterium]|nr:2,3-bisphosphoglycerate-independent phosphoglycerate mutase [Bacilli bacterium]